MYGTLNAFEGAIITLKIPCEALFLILNELLSKQFQQLQLPRPKKRISNGGEWRKVAYRFGIFKSKRCPRK